MSRSSVMVIAILVFALAAGSVWAQQRQQELLGPILEQVGAVIETLRSEGNYSIVLDASKEGLVAADTTLDITDAVLARLGVEAPPPAPAGGATP